MISRTTGAVSPRPRSTYRRTWATGDPSDHSKKAWGRTPVASLSASSTAAIAFGAAGLDTRRTWYGPSVIPRTAKDVPEVRWVVDVHFEEQHVCVSRDGIHRPLLGLLRGVLRDVAGLALVGDDVQSTVVVQ